MNNNQNYCFVLMPFDEKFNNPWQFAIKAAAKENGLEPLRADTKHLAGGIITRDITNLIINAKLIVAEMTDQNPNVLYELGLSHAAKKKVIMITQNESDIPFDVKGIRYIRYNVNHLSQLHESLSTAINVLLNTSNLSEHDFFPELKIVSQETNLEIERLKTENKELVSLANVIRITTIPEFAHVFLNNRYVGMSPQTIHVNPYNTRNFLTIFATRYFEHFQEINSDDIRFKGIHIKLDKMDPRQYPKRVHNWLNHVRLQPDDIVIGYGIARYLIDIGEHKAAIAELERLIKVNNDGWGVLYNGIGYAYSMLKEYEMALKYFMLVKEKVNLFYLGSFNSACIYSENSEFEKCLAEMENIVRTPIFVKQMKELLGIEAFDQDRDFDNIRNDPVYKSKFSDLNNQFKIKVEEI